MITLHTTKKLFTKIPVEESGSLPNAADYTPKEQITGDNPLDHWHANLLTIQRRNCVIMVHNETRFPIFMKGLVKDDFAKLDWHFQDAFMNTLLKLGVNETIMDSAASLLEPLSFNTECVRSVQGTMNQMAGDVKHMIDYDGADIEDLSAYRMGVWLANRPCTVKGKKDCVWPDKEMIELLHKVAQENGDSSVGSNVTQMR